MPRSCSAHSRYARFVEYGDADAYQDSAEALRRDFRDLREPGGK